MFTAAVMAFSALAAAPATATPSPSPSPTPSAPVPDSPTPAPVQLPTPVPLIVGTPPELPEEPAPAAPKATLAQSTDAEKGKAAAILGIVAGPELMILTDRNFTAAMYYAADDLDKQHPLEPEHRKVKDAAVAALGDSDDACTTFIKTGMAAAHSQDQAIVADRRARQEEDRTAKAKAAGLLGVPADNTDLAKSVYDFIVHLDLNADNHKDTAVKDAARTALRGTADAQWTFLTVGIYDEHRKDTERLIREDEAKSEAEKAAALAREAKANAAWHALGIRGDEALINLSDQDFVIEIWSRAPRDTEVHGAAEAAVRSRNPADWKAFIDRGAKDAHLRDIDNELRKRDEEYVRQITEIRTRAVKTRVHPALVTAADAALAGSPTDRERFLRTGQDENLTQSLRTLTRQADEGYLTDSGGQATLTLWQPGNHPEQSWKIEPGLADPACFSLQSVTRPNNYLRWDKDRRGGGGPTEAYVTVSPTDGTPAFRDEATWCVQGTTITFRPRGNPGLALYPENALGAAWQIDTPAPPTPFDVRYSRDEKVRANLGKPIADPVLDANNLGYRVYEKGRLYLTRYTNTQVHPIYNGPILDKFLALGGPGTLGGMLTDQTTTPDGKGHILQITNAQGSYYPLSIIWSPASGAHEIHGVIGDTWSKSGGVTGLLGYPTTDETAFGTAGGQYNRFTGGSIYWMPAIGARTITGDIHTKFAALGYENGPLGYPTGQETSFAVEGGVFQRFSTGSIYRTTVHGVRAVTGDIHKKYAELGYEAGFVTYPISDETPTSDGVGKHIKFKTGVAIYWHPTTGAHPVYGNIRSKWDALGSEKSYLGYPTTDEQALPKGRRSNFQNGRIDWSNDGGGTIDYKTVTMTPGSIELKNANGGRCIQVAGVGQDALRDSAATELWDCVAGAKQIWKLTHLGNNKYTLKSQNSGKCLDLPTNYNNGTSIVQYPCHGDLNQQWEFTTAANNTLALRSVYSAKIVETLGNGTTNATLVTQGADLGNPNQRWTPIQISTTP
ncbi:RICIN domain-containing protein [Amycolatopsis sp. cmx-11-51]|uniref:RICIN domain-containing protein n=1 Tax=unclassified Amycolatopsis TaxID=2618356 RepID=UPI0039E317C1